MKAVIGTTDGVPQELAIVNEDSDAEVLRTALANLHYFDRMDVITVTLPAVLLAFVTDEVEQD